jgi:hypothetical protein
MVAELGWEALGQGVEESVKDMVRDIFWVRVVKPVLEGVMEVVEELVPPPPPPLPWAPWLAAAGEEEGEEDTFGEREWEDVKEGELV